MAGLVLAWLGLSVSGVHADGWAPGISVATRLDDGSSQGPDVDPWITTVVPQLNVSRLGPLASWEIGAQRSFDSYTRTPAPRPATDRASLRTWSALAQDTRVSLEGRYLRSRDPLHLDAQAPLTSGPSEIFSGSAEGRFWRGGMAYQMRARTYEAPSLVDGAFQSAKAVLYPLRREHGRLLLLGGWREWRVGGDRTLAASLVTVGYQRDHTAAVSSELEVGAVEVDDRRRGDRHREVAAAAGLTVAGALAGLPLDLRARFARDVTTTGMAEISRSIGGRRLAARWERSVDAEGGLFVESTLRDLVGIEVQDTLSERTLVALEGGYGRTWLREASGLRVEKYRASASVARRLQPWLTGRATYSYVEQTEAEGPISSYSRRSRVELSLTAVP